MHKFLGVIFYEFQSCHSEGATFFVEKNASEESRLCTHHQQAWQQPRGEILHGDTLVQDDIISQHGRPMNAKRYAQVFVGGCLSQPLEMK